MAENSQLQMLWVLSKVYDKLILQQLLKLALNVLILDHNKLLRTDILLDINNIKIHFTRIKNF